jgi:hypothetical protein
MENNKFLTVSEYAAMSGVSVQAVYKRINKGSLKSIKQGNITYIDTEGSSAEAIKPIKTEIKPEGLNGLNRFNEHEEDPEIIEKAFSAWVDEGPENITFDDFLLKFKEGLNDSTPILNQLNPGLNKPLNQFKPQLNPEERQQKEGQDSQSAETLQILKDTIDILKQQNETQAAQLETFREQLKEKDRQISELNERLKESLSLTDQQQHLQAATEGRLQALEKQTEDQETQPQPETIRHWWQFWK